MEGNCPWIAPSPCAREPGPTPWGGSRRTPQGLIARGSPRVPDEASIPNKNPRPGNRWANGEVGAQGCTGVRATGGAGLRAESRGRASERASVCTRKGHARSAHDEADEPIWCEGRRRRVHKGRSLDSVSFRGVLGLGHVVVQAVLGRGQERQSLPLSYRLACRRHGGAAFLQARSLAEII